MSLFKMIVSVAFALAVASTSLAQDARALVIEGNGAFAQASALRDTDPARARELFQAAIDAWGSAMESGGFENGMLHYNIANAHLMRDEVGLAVLHYREADELMPGDRNIRANLAQARRRVPGGSPSSGRAGGAMETVLFFHSGLTERTRFGVTLVAFALTWVLATLVTLRVLPRGALWFVALACVVWIATGTSLAVDAADTTVQGVVIGGEVVGRKGPDERGYEPSFTEALSEGVEFTLVERRGEWALIRLADDRETWIPGRSVGVVGGRSPGSRAGSSI